MTLHCGGHSKTPGITRLDHVLVNGLRPARISKRRMAVEVVRVDVHGAAEHLRVPRWGHLRSELDARQVADGERFHVDQVVMPWRRQSEPPEQTTEAFLVE